MVGYGNVIFSNGVSVPREELEKEAVETRCYIHGYNHRGEPIFGDIHYYFNSKGEEIGYYITGGIAGGPYDSAVRHDKPCGPWSNELLKQTKVISRRFDMQRVWTEVGKEAGYEREEIEAAIDKLEWEPFRTTDLPFCQGETIKTVCRECKVPVSKITRMALHGQIKNSHGFYGLDVEYKNARVQIYIADNGCEATPVAMDVWEKQAV